MEVNQLAGPFVLALLMMVIGLELTPADFRRVFASPRAVIGGTLGQLIALPLMTWLVVFATGVNPVYGAGAILVAVSPGAGMSNVFTALARANVALSVTLTAVSSVLAALSMPVIASFGMQVFLGDSRPVAVPVADLMWQLGLSLVVPLGLGMWLRAARPAFAERYAPAIQRILFAIILVFVGLAIAYSDEGQVQFEGSGLAFLAATLWTLAAMAIGFGIAWILDLPEADRFTFLIEFSARNIAVASIVAISGLGRIDLTLFSGVYAMVGYPMTAGIVIWHRRRVGRATRAAASG
jgi:BASS family bile acid:Na+ symporter